MATHQFAATIKFMAVAGEEEGLYGSAFFAKNAKAQGMDIEGMLNNDIIGSDTGDLGQKMPFTIRLFSEGVPTAETPDQAANLQNVGGESDSPARELARYVQEVAQNSATHMQIEQVFRRDRYLRGGDQISFLEQGYPAVRFTEPIENFDHEHQDVRVENGVQCTGAVPRARRGAGRASAPTVGREALPAQGCTGSSPRARRRGGYRCRWSAGRPGLGSLRSGRPVPTALRCSARCRSRRRGRRRSVRPAGGHRTRTSLRWRSSPGRTLGRRIRSGGPARRRGTGRRRGSSRGWPERPSVNWRSAEGRTGRSWRSP